MINKEQLEHVFFDLDHTLWDFDRNSDLAFNFIFKQNKITIDIEDFLKVYKPINFEYWKWYREGRVTKAQLRYGRLKKTFNKLGVQISDHLIDKLSEDYIEALPEHNYLLPGAMNLLEYVASKYKLHIITNGFEKVQLEKIRRSKLSHFFDTITSSEAVGVKKPDPQIFNFAMRQAGAKAKSSVMIGDTYEADIIGAIGVEMPVIFYNYHNLKQFGEVITVNNLKDIIKIL